jgi:hypothetical protein
MLVSCFSTDVPTTTTTLGCPAESPPVDLLDQLTFARDSIPQFTTLGDTLRTNTGLFEETCGTPPDLILGEADVVTSALCGVADILRDVRVFFNCENFNPLYQGITYDTVCYSGTDGFAWVASTQFVIVFMAMVILTCRVTFTPKKEQNSLPATQDYKEAPPPHSPKSVAISPLPYREAHQVQPNYSDEGGYPQIEMVDSDLIQEPSPKGGD